MSNVPYNPQSLTVLVVDDHDPIRKAIKRVLASIGFGEIFECFDGEDALKILQQKPVDLIICDLYMRNVSGFEVLEYVRNRDVGSDIPVIIVTGEASKEDIVKAADIGAEDYILKPFQATDFEKKVEKVLTKYHSPTPLIKALRYGERQIMQGDFDNAMKAFEAALKIDPDSARAAHGKSITLGKLGRIDEALSLLNETLKRNHSFHKNYSVMADLFLRQDRVLDAIAAMKRELQINPKQPNRQIELAKLLLKEGDALGAVDHYRVALQDDPRRLSALMGMGHAFAMAENIEKALYYFKRVRRYHPKATKALEAVVRHSLGVREPKRAELLLKDEKFANPDRLDTYSVLAMFYLQQEREDDAVVTLDELLAKDPENAQALRLKANIAIKKGDYQQAVQHLDRLSRVAPSADTLVLQGEAHIGLNQIPEAMHCLHKALSMHPDHPQAFFLLGESHRKSQQWIKAYYLYRKAFRMGASKERCQSMARECFGEIHGRRRSRGAA